MWKKKVNFFYTTPSFVCFKENVVHSDECVCMSWSFSFFCSTFHIRIWRCFCQSSLSESQALQGLLSSNEGFLELSRKYWNNSGPQRDRSIMWSTGYLEQSHFYLHCWPSTLAKMVGCWIVVFLFFNSQNQNIIKGIST